MICTSTVHTKKKHHECTNKNVIHAGFAFFKFELLKSSMSWVKIVLSTKSLIEINN